MEVRGERKDGNSMKGLKNDEAERNRFKLGVKESDGPTPQALNICHYLK
jgi:hypothetical protein